MKTLAENRKARFDYEILETFEAGLILTGQEVKSILAGRLNLSGSYVIIKPNGAYLLNANLPPYQPKNTPSDYDPSRNRGLLLKKEELKYLIGKAKESSLTIVPLSCYTNKSKVKLSIGLARHKKTQDKRETIRERQTNREINRALKRE